MRILHEQEKGHLNRQAERAFAEAKNATVLNQIYLSGDVDEELTYLTHDVAGAITHVNRVTLARSSLAPSLCASLSPHYPPHLLPDFLPDFLSPWLLALGRLWIRLQILPQISFRLGSSL